MEPAYEVERSKRKKAVGDVCPRQMSMIGHGVSICLICVAYFTCITLVCTIIIN